MTAQEIHDRQMQLMLAASVRFVHHPDVFPKRPKPEGKP